MRILGAFIASALLMHLAPAAHAAVSVHIDQSAQRMTVRENGQTIGVWAVSTAQVGMRTPNGTYRPYMLSRNHRSSLYNWAPMPYSVFFRGNYAIHGTTSIRQLGQPASHGCIRLHPANARTLFELVQRHGMRNVSIRITGATGGFAVARRAAAARVAAAQQQRRNAAALQRQRMRATAEYGFGRPPASFYSVSPHYYYNTY